MSPERLWWVSTWMHASGRLRLASLISKINYWMFRVDLPPEARIQRDLVLFHRGMGVVVNPNVEIGRDVRIVHGVTIGCMGEGDQRGRVVIGNGVRIGVNATIIAAPNTTVVIGDGCQVGACAYVRDSMAPGTIALGATASFRDGSTG